MSSLHAVLLMLSTFPLVSCILHCSQGDFFAEDLELCSCSSITDWNECCLDDNDGCHCYLGACPAPPPVTEAPPTEAPPTEAPPTEAPPTEAPPTEAPPTEAPPTEAPTTEAPASVCPSIPPLAGRFLGGVGAHACEDRGVIAFFSHEILCHGVLMIDDGRRVIRVPKRCWDTVDPYLQDCGCLQLMYRQKLFDYEDCYHTEHTEASDTDIVVLRLSDVLASLLDKVSLPDCQNIACAPSSLQITPYQVDQCFALSYANPDPTKPYEKKLTKISIKPYLSAGEGSPCDVADVPPDDASKYACWQSDTGAICGLQDSDAPVFCPGTVDVFVMGFIMGKDVCDENNRNFWVRKLSLQ